MYVVLTAIMGMTNAIIIAAGTLDFPNQRTNPMSNETEAPELKAALEAHGLKTDKPSQLSDAFRLGWNTRADLSDVKDKRIEELEVKLDRVLREYYDVDLADAEPQSLTDAILEARATLTQLQNTTAIRG